ncbi:MAG: protein-disulfide reductase DsbD family protein [Stellaceae bacterium]
MNAAMGWVNRRCGPGFRVIAGVFLALVAIWPAVAFAAATGWIGDDHAASRLITAVEATGVADTITAGIEIRLAPGWHTYWRSPGDAGIAPSIDWSGSSNLARATIAWPAPQRYSLQGFETAGYRNQIVLPVRLSLARAGRPLPLHVTLAYAACSQICVPYTAKLALTLPAGPAVRAPEAGLIAAAQRQVPESLAAAGIELVSANTVRKGHDTSLIVRLRAGGTPLHAPDLFVEGLTDGSPGRPQVALTASGHIARLTVPIRDAGSALIAGKRLTLTLVDGARAAVFTATPRTGSPPGSDARLLTILAIALLGGLVLNAMPCVLPVLSLKLLSLASQAGADRRRVRIGLVMTALGVLASFALIAAALIVAKAGGAAVGWGMQFQWPWFIAAMAALTTLFAASLWGWLAIGLPRLVYDAAAVGRSRRPYADAFLTGAFATLLATPCSAPFVGTAVGFALAQGPRLILLVFAALGLGFASPYLAVATVPRLVRLLPRPGRWMDRLRVLLGLALLATAAWLITVLAALSGAAVAFGTAAALTAVLLLLAVRRRPGFPLSAVRVASTTATVLIGAAILWPALAGVAPGGTAKPDGRWQAFDPAAIPRLVGENRIVFVDVTAAWCLTCKVNEAAVLDRAPVAARLFGPGVVAMRGDWTRPDPALTRYLQSFGRYGIPFNAVYGPRQPAGQVLPELLTATAVDRALDRAAAPATVAR